ncbi:hypothetical protein G4229_05910 [Listeria seeligeri]|nr:hypothetical protein [Listeria seeligeri]MBT0133223.1 hypothetical protein [Listeria seeligeri]
MSTRVMYPVEIKEEAIKMKLAGKATKEIMDTLNIKNPTQVKIWTLNIIMKKEFNKN